PARGPAPSARCRGTPAWCPSRAPRSPGSRRPRSGRTDRYRSPGRSYGVDAGTRPGAAPIKGERGLADEAQPATVAGHQRPSRTDRTDSAATPAVEVRRTVSPSRTGTAPAATNTASSSGAIPPSGPTTTTTSPAGSSTVDSRAVASSWSTNVGRSSAVDDGSDTTRTHA